jgi:uncharacterized protein (TIGR03435 family)
VRTPFLCSLIFLAAGSFAQTASDEPSFEAASVKKSDPNSTAPSHACKGGPGTSDPGMFTCTRSGLSGFVCIAYNIQFYELVAPEWMSFGGVNGYDIAAKVPAGADRGQFRAMLRNLLADRFHLVVHNEARERQTYVLRHGVRDPKLVHSTQPPPPGPRFTTARVDGHYRNSMHNSPMSRLADFLTVFVGNPVTDETALEGDYDLTLEFTPDERWLGYTSVPHDAPPTAPDLAQAIETQLGLKLESRKAPVTVLVVDRADKVPVAN